jgi:aspartyl protease family protein
MLRWYFVIVVALVVIGSLLGRNTASMPANDHLIITHAAAASAAPSGEAGPGGRQSINALDRSIELTRDEDGHFYANVQINGAPVRMLVDTGASIIALSRSDAQMAGIATSIGMNDVVGEGADGAVHGEQVMIERVTLGDKTVEGLPAIVLNSGGQSLLGQSFLSKFASVHIEEDKMVLR